MSHNTNYSGHASGFTKVYVGGLVDDVGNDKLQKIFSKFGLVRKVWVARNPGSKGYAFIDFDEREAAEEAIKEMHGKSFMGAKLRVQFSNNKLAATPANSKKSGKAKALATNEMSVLNSVETSFSDRAKPDRLLDIDILNSDPIRQFRTPALETLMHLEKLARIRLEREYLERYYNKSSSAEFNERSTELSLLRDMVFQDSSRSELSAVVEDLLREPCRSDGDGKGPLHSTSPPVSSEFHAMFQSSSNKCYTNTESQIPEQQNKYPNVNSSIHVCTQHSQDTFSGMNSNAQNMYTRVKFNSKRFQPYNTQSITNTIAATSSRKLSPPAISNRNANHELDKVPHRGYYQRNKHEHGSGNDWYGNTFYGFSFLPHSDSRDDKNSPQNNSFSSQYSPSQSTPKHTSIGHPPYIY